ncbi:unnamed protein product, partial [Symbiodinium sp. KB8]
MLEVVEVGRSCDSAHDVNCFQITVLANLLDDPVLHSELQDMYEAAVEGGAEPLPECLATAEKLKRGKLGGWWKGLTMGPTLDIRRKNEDLRKLLKKTPWPMLKYFSADGRTYGLPLKAESGELSHRPAKARLEYLAGFFDGDGCVSCAWNLSGCRLKVGQSYDQAEVLMLLREAFGGSIVRECDGIGLRKPVLRWLACGQSARRAAELLAPHSITKQKQLLLAGQWPETKSRREDCKAKLRALKNYDSAVAGLCSWSYCAGFFDAEGCIVQQHGGASLVLAIGQKHPQVLKCLRDFLSRSVGMDASLRKSGTNLHLLSIYGLSTCKRVLRHMLGAGLVCKAQQAEVALRLTKQNAGQVCARLTCLTGNQEFGRKLDTAGQERAREIKRQAAYLKRPGRMTEAEAKLREVALLRQEHEALKARHENQQSLEYLGKLQWLHENSWKGYLAKTVAAWREFPEKWAELVALSSSEDDLRKVIDYAMASQSHRLRRLALARGLRAGPAEAAAAGAVEMSTAILTEISQMKTKVAAVGDDDPIHTMVELGVFLLASLVKGARSSTLPKLSGADFQEASRYVWEQKQDHPQIITALCYVLQALALKLTKWQVQLNDAGDWADLAAERQLELRKATEKGETVIHFRERGFPYEIDLKEMTQKNLKTGTTRTIQEVEVPVSTLAGDGGAEEE